jgi:hypothetical protein
MHRLVFKCNNIKHLFFSSFVLFLYLTKIIEIFSNMINGNLKNNLNIKRNKKTF